MTQKSLYEQMVEAGEEVHSHYSDMYVFVNPTTRALVTDYRFKSSVTTFRSNTDGKMMYDIPFAYDPYWKSKELPPMVAGDTANALASAGKL